MNPLMKAFSGAAVRWLLVLAGAYGIDLPADNAETMVNGVLIGGPLLWSLYQKWRAHTRIQTAELLVTLAERRSQPWA